MTEVLGIEGCGISHLQYFCKSYALDFGGDIVSFISMVLPELLHLTVLHVYILFYCLFDFKLCNWKP